jgi:hypothetical protein
LRPQDFIRANGVEVIIPKTKQNLDFVSLTLKQWAGQHLLLPHGRQREFLLWDVQIGPVILEGLH